MTKDPVVIAMPVVRVMEVPLDEVVDVIAVRHGIMAAAGTVDVVGRMSLAGVSGRTRRRIGGVHGDRALVDMVSMHRVEMTIMKVVDMVTMADRGVTAADTVDVVVVSVGLVAHPSPPLSDSQLDGCRKR